MLWKREPVLSFIVILLFSAGTYVIQDWRAQDAFDYSTAYSGDLKFRGNYTVDGDRLRGFAQLNDGPVVYATYRIKSAQEKEKLEQMLYKSTLQVKGLFEAPSPSPHRYAFNMESYMGKSGASKILAIESIYSATEDRTIFSKLSSQREKIKRHIRDTFPENLVAEAEALLIGEQEKMTPDEQRIYQTLGITHLFAISGLHVEIVAGLIYFGLIRMRLRKESVVLLMLVALPVYAVIAGGAPSVWRSIGMVEVVLVCRLLRIKLPIAQILLLSFTCYLFWNPYSFYNIGFQLSYGATFAIIFSFSFLSRQTSVVRIGFLITCISQLTLYPLLLFHFYELSLSAFVVNSLFVPLYTLVILPVNFFLFGATLVFQPLADMAFSCYEPLRSFIGSGMEWMAGLPYQMWTPGKPSLGMVLLLMASVFIFYSLAERGFHWSQLLIVLVPAIGLSVAPYMDPELKVSFLDVGQGDSVLIELPYRSAVYLIDSGGLLRFDQEAFRERVRPYEIGRQIVAPYLKGKGITKIDKFILSHADADHAEGAEELFQLFRIDELHLSPGSDDTALMQDLLPYTAEAHIRFPGRGSSWQKRGINFAYIAPNDANYEGNNDSLVLLMEAGEFRVLFTGDLEAEGEEELLKRYGGALSDIAVLKVGHHGSKSSSSETFLTAVSPGLSIFSTGRDNRYGHPNEEVVERFRELELATLNTADSGTIEVALKNGKASVRTMR
ncbi:DNA internalization-related competence protein ComEC/Rec2 [Planococcus sp. N028]|uniref:DNA internalization-related competence protein ComEC/Rec2 n=1 Tax=Planococcus shixiaomingii TaxID=3058393 RepID=A0ABT8MXP9_9BACL|nr:DNA internalization-related competence protein ComEC/Rec2 [Planococcus sp. N028]MDN7240419.1 DNA internalization-related competence protein ComEC/Rec2 [Planococcus sp. N028]